MTLNPHAAAVFLALAIIPSTARAEEVGTEQGDIEQGAPFDVEFSIAAASDYRFRGVSLTDKDPVIQGSLTVTHASGLYANLWGSSISENGGADIENQVLLGYYAAVGDISVDLQSAYYVYPGASSDNYAEFTARLAHQVSAGEVGAIVSYAPAQANIGGIDNLYVAIDASHPIAGTPFTLEASIGIEDGAFGDAKRDWSLGLSAEAGKWTFGLFYVDASRTMNDPNADPTAVLSVMATF